MANNNIARSRSDPKNVECRDCARLLATIAPTGLVPVDSQAQACDTCRDFSAFYETLEIARGEFEILRSKRQDHRGRQMAREAASRARITFENFLMRVEAGIIRKNREDEEKGELENNQGLKRCHSNDFLPTRKRLQFSGLIEDRDDYRNYLEFNRHEDTYVPGRYAPPGGTEYLDTSGHSQTLSKFSRTKKVGSQWIELKEEDDEKNKGLTNDETKDKASTKAESPTTTMEEGMREVAEPEPDERALRLVRRRVSPSLEAQQTCSKTSLIGRIGKTYNASKNAHYALQVHDSQEKISDIESAGVTSPYENGILHLSNKRRQPVSVDNSNAADDRADRREKIWMQDTAGVHDSSSFQEKDTSEGSAERDSRGSTAPFHVKQEEALASAMNTASRIPVEGITNTDKRVEQDTKGVGAITTDKRLKEIKQTNCPDAADLTTSSDPADLIPQKEISIRAVTNFMQGCT